MTDFVSTLQDVRKQLYTDEDDCTFFAWIQRERRAVEDRLADGAAALQHLEMALINTACDDPGAAIGAQLALPLLQVCGPNLSSTTSKTCIQNLKASCFSGSEAPGAGARQYRLQRSGRRCRRAARAAAAVGASLWPLLS